MPSAPAVSRRIPAIVLVLAALVMHTATAVAQQTPAASAPTGPKVGDAAPDFSLPGATRYGRLQEPVTLSALRGKTVVLAFFIKARTRG